jgi:hypothetical protein
VKFLFENNLSLDRLFEAALVMARHMTLGPTRKRNVLHVWHVSGQKKEGRMKYELAVIKVTMLGGP